MPADSQAFARRVLDAFLAAGHTTDALVIAAKGPSTSTMTKLRKVAEGHETMPEPREPTWSKIDTAADWAPGSARRVWLGGEPIATKFREGGDQDDDSIEGVMSILPAFDGLQPSARDNLVEIAHQLARTDDARERPDYVMEETDGSRMGIEVEADGEELSDEDFDQALSLAGDLLWKLDDASSVVIQVVTPDGLDDGFTIFRRVPAPQVILRVADAARDVGGASKGQQRRAAADRAGEPPVDDPEDMEPR